MKNKAFSLIELLQTVIVIGIIATLTVNFLSNLNVDSKLYGTTIKILQDATRQIKIDICDTLSASQTDACGLTTNSFTPDISAETDRTFCERLGTYVNHIGTPNCATSYWEYVTNREPKDKPNYILDNGVRLYGLEDLKKENMDSESSWIVYMDVDRKPYADKLNEDILCFKIKKSGEITEMTACPDE